MRRAGSAFADSDSSMTASGIAYALSAAQATTIGAAVAMLVILGVLLWRAKYSRVFVVLPWSIAFFLVMVLLSDGANRPALRFSWPATRELLGFDAKLPGEGGGALAKDYDLGPGRGVQPTRTVETRRCVLGLGRGSHEALVGTTLARFALEAAQDGAYALRLAGLGAKVAVSDINLKSYAEFEAEAAATAGIELPAAAAASGGRA